VDDAEVTGQAPNAAGRRPTSAAIWILAICLGLVLFVLPYALQAYVVKPYRIPTVSMAPTLQSGDRILADRSSYRFHEPRRGDIVVLRWPVDQKTIFVKRVVAVAGDRIELRAGSVVVNGTVVDEPYLARDASGSPVPTEAAPVDAQREAGPWSLARPYTVPSGCCYVMGDNRGNSQDSRFWGPVADDDVIGRVWLIYWPLDRAGGL
jgi:signal peptidase I